MVVKRDLEKTNLLAPKQGNTIPKISEDDLVTATSKCTVSEDKGCQTDADPLNLISARVPSGINAHQYVALADERHVRRLFASKTDVGDCNSNTLSIANLNHFVDTSSGSKCSQIVRADSVEAFSKLMDAQIDAIRKSSQRFNIFRLSKRKRKVAKDLEQMQTNMTNFLGRLKGSYKGERKETISTD